MTMQYQLTRAWDDRALAAYYRVGNDDRLKRLKRWPRELDVV